MDPIAYTTESTEAGERYTVVLAAFRSLLFSYLARPFSTKSMRALREDAQDIADAFARSETKLIRTVITDTAQNAQRSALSDLQLSGRPETPEALQAFLTQSEDHLLIEIGSQLARDVETLVKRYREFGLEAQLKAFANPFNTNIPEAERVRFYYRDRAGRLIPSQRFVRVAWRQSLVTLAAEFYLLEAAQRGAKTVTVEHPDPKHKWFGTVIRLSSDQRGESFSEVRDEIFHPMTEAVLKARP